MNIGSNVKQILISTKKSDNHRKAPSKIFIMDLWIAPAGGCTRLDFLHRGVGNCQVIQLFIAFLVIKLLLWLILKLLLSKKIKQSVRYRFEILSQQAWNIQIGTAVKAQKSTGGVENTGTHRGVMFSRKKELIWSRTRIYSLKTCPSRPSRPSQVPIILS